MRDDHKKVGGTLLLIVMIRPYSVSFVTTVRRRPRSASYQQFHKKVDNIRKLHKRISMT